MLVLLALLVLLGLCNEAGAFVLTPRRPFAQTKATTTTGTTTAKASGVGLRATSQIGGNWSYDGQKLTATTINNLMGNQVGPGLGL